MAGMGLYEISSHRMMVLCFLLFAVHLVNGGKGGFYAYTVKDIQGKAVSLEKYKGKVSLVVNVASECGYTESHYKEMKSLYDELAIKSKHPFTVLAFPCNQFGEQEPHSNQEIEHFVKETYGVEFPIFSKLDVIDFQAHPVYRFLTEKSGYSPTWNFWKYLINEDGDVIDAWGPRVSIETIKPTILKAINDAKSKHREL